MKIEDKKLENGDLEIKFTFNSHDQICLEHDLLDIKAWYSSGPCAEKIANCKKRMINENKEKILKSEKLQSMTMVEVNALMDDDVKLCKMIKEMPEYKNRAQREANQLV